jgi:tetratricopeptide (TPR) repeat protein
MTPARPLEICGAELDQSVVKPGLQPADIPAFIRTLAAAARGAPDLERRLAKLRASAGGDQAMPEFWRIRVLEIVAVSQARERNFAAAITAMQEATAIEEELGKPPGPPAAYKPPHELFGEILLQAGKPADAAAQFQKNLVLHPNRALSILGQARAEAAMGANASARASYTRLLEVWRQADENLAELHEAREFVSSHHG